MFAGSNWDAEDYDDWIVEAQPGYGYWLDYLITEAMPRAD